MQAFQNLDIASLKPGIGMRMQDLVGDAAIVARLSRAVEMWIEEEKQVFSCQGIELSAEEVAAGDGLLPLVLHQAQEYLAKATGSVFPDAVVHQESETGLCGVAVAELRHMSVGQWFLFSSFALEARVKEHGLSGPVPVDAWYEKWQKALEAQQVRVLPASVQPQPSPGATRA